MFETIHIPGALGFAIIALTLLIRLILHPLFKQQIELGRKMQEMKPHLDRLSEKHKHDKTRLQQEQMRLYREAGVNPASGCLFMLIQIPVFIGLYNTLSLFLINNGHKTIDAVNHVLYFPILHIQSVNPDFLGINLALSPAKAKMWVYYLIPVITGVLQYLQVKVTTPEAPKSVEVKKKKEEESGSDDFQKAMSMQMKFLFPLMIGYFSYTLPVGLSLYWNIFSIFSIAHYRKPKEIKNKKSKINA